MTLRQALQGAIPCLHYKTNRKFYEVAIVNGRTGKHYLGTIKEDGTFECPTTAQMTLNGTYGRLMDTAVYSWTHTDKTILIIL